MIPMSSGAGLGAAANTLIVYTHDVDGICTMSEGPGLAALGLEPGEMVGADLYHAYADEPDALDPIHRVLAGETFTVELVSHGRIMETYHQPLLGDRGEIVGGLGVVNDVTERRTIERQAKQARRRIGLLGDLSTTLAREVSDPSALLHTVVHTATGAVGDACALWLCPPGSDHLVLRASYERQGVSARPQWGPGGDPRPVTLDAARIDEVKRSETTSQVDLDTWVVAAGGEGLRRDDLSADHTWVLDPALPVRVRVPLRARGRLVGALEVGRRAVMGELADDDVDLAVDIAERCALALDNALLLHTQREALEQSEKFRALAEAADELVAIADPDGFVVYTNPRLDQLGVGWRGRRLVEALDASAVEHRSEELTAGLAADGRWAGDLTLALPEGDVVVRAELFEIFHSHTEAPVGTAWIAQDVTDLRAAEEALREANGDLKQFKALVEASPEFIAIAGVDGLVTYVNPAGLRMVGLPPDVDVSTTTIADYLTEEGLRASVEVEQPAVMEHGHWEGESTLRNLRGGPPIPVSIASFLVRDAETGEPFALATVQRDLTERVAAETAARELAETRQQLLTRLVDAQDAERAQIAAEVHDDSVQALAAVDLRLGLLKRRIREEAPQLLEVVEPVRSSVSAATDRLRNLLFDLAPPDLDSGLGAALRTAAAEIFDQTPVHVAVHAADEPAMPDSLLAVAYRIAKEAMFNVLKHAGADRVTVTVGGEDGGLLLTVVDDGVGLREQAPAPVTGHLGMASMRDRAHIAGGRFTAEAVEGGGTRVTVWLPGQDA